MVAIKKKEEQVVDFSPNAMLKSINPDFFNKVGLPICANDDDEDFEPDVYELDLTEPQFLFYTSEATHPLFVAGFGSGKSKTLALCALTDLINFKGANIGVYAPTYDLMTLILVPYISELLTEGGYEFDYNGGHHWFEVEGYGRIICRSLDNPRRIVGYETFRAHCDELDTLPLEKAEAVWIKIVGRNRQKVYVRDDEGNKVLEREADGSIKRDKNGRRVYKMHKNRVSAYTTPEGWNFAYKRWIEDKKEGDGYEHVTASTYSNEHNLPPDYIPNLIKSYPPELITAYVEGKFTNLKSGRVYRNFDRTLNSCDTEVEGNELIRIGVDFNVDHGHALIYVERRNEDGELEDHCVDEICDSHDTEDTIRIIEERYPDNPIEFYPDASGKNRKSSGNGVDSKGKATSTDLWHLRQVKRAKVIVDLANPAIKDRVACVGGRILNGEGKRLYKVNVKKCPGHTKTLEQQTWKEGLPDKSTGLDHSGDCAGYVMHKLRPIVKRRNGYLAVGD